MLDLFYVFVVLHLLHRSSPFPIVPLIIIPHYYLIILLIIIIILSLSLLSFDPVPSFHYFPSILSLWREGEIRYRLIAGLY